MEEEFNWKQYWNVNAAGKRKRERVKKRKEEERKLRLKQKRIKPPKPIVPTSTQWSVYAMYNGTRHDNKLQYLSAVNQIQEHIKEPVERYELKDNTIIRTVSTFHYLSQELNVNGICRSFYKLSKIRSKHMKITGKEEVFNVYNEIMNEFRRRYYIGRIMKMDFSKTDLDKDIKVSRITMERVNYIFISMKDRFSDTWGKPKMFRLKQRFIDGTLNTKIAPYLSQEEIIEKIKAGKITGIHPYGNPDGILSNDYVLKMLEK